MRSTESTTPHRNKRNEELPETGLDEEQSRSMVSRLLRVRKSTTREAIEQEALIMSKQELSRKVKTGKDNLSEVKRVGIEGPLGAFTQILTDKGFVPVVEILGDVESYSVLSPIDNKYYPVRVNPCGMRKTCEAVYIVGGPGPRKQEWELETTLWPPAFVSVAPVRPGYSPVHWFLGFYERVGNGDGTIDEKSIPKRMAGRLLDFCFLTGGKYHASTPFLDCDAPEKLKGTNEIASWISGYIGAIEKTHMIVSGDPRLLTWIHYNCLMAGYIPGAINKTEQDKGPAFGEYYYRMRIQKARDIEGFKLRRAKELPLSPCYEVLTDAPEKAFVIHGGLLGFGK